jgi:hypothetical protein
MAKRVLDISHRYRYCDYVLYHFLLIVGIIVEDKMIFAIKKNIASGNLVLRELLFTLTRAIQAQFIYIIESLL